MSEVSIQLVARSFLGGEDFLQIGDYRNKMEELSHFFEILGLIIIIVELHATMEVG